MKMGRGASFTFTQGKFEGKGMSMEMLASISSLFLPLPAVNRTGLDGFYDYHLDLVPEDFSLMMSTAAAKRLAASADRTAQLALMTPTSYFSALDKVGLKLEKGKTMIEVLNIDDVKKVPTEN